MHFVFIVVPALAKYLKCKKKHFMLSVALEPPVFDPKMAISRIFRHKLRLKGQFYTRVHMLEPVPTKHMKRRMTFFMNSMDL